MQGNNINTVYVNTWRFYAGSYPYNANGEQDRTKIGIKGSVWLYGKDSNGNSFELDPSRRNSYNDFDDPDLYSINISKAVVTSITRRTNLATGEPMPDTWNNGTGHIYITAKNSDNESLYDTSIEVTADSAIYQAGLAAAGDFDLNDLTFAPQVITQRNETTHISFTKVNSTVYANDKTVEGILNISANGKTITKNISMSAIDVYESGEGSVEIKSNEENGIYAVTNSGEWDREVAITNKNQTVYQNGMLYGYVNIALTNNKTYTARVGINASRAISSPNLSSLTFTPQPIAQSQTIDISFTEGHGTVYVNGRTVEGILKIEVGEQSITKNISMTAAGVYNKGWDESLTSATVSSLGVTKKSDADPQYYPSTIGGVKRWLIPVTIFGRVNGTKSDNTPYQSQQYTSSDQSILDFTTIYNDIIENSGGSRTITGLSWTESGSYDNVDATFDKGESQTNIPLPKVQNKTLYQFAYGIGYGEGRNSVDTLKTVDGTPQVFYASSGNTTDYTKIQITLENNKEINNIELPKVENKTLYQYAYDLGVAEASPPFITHSITPATGNDWTNTVKQYNFTINDNAAGNVRLYVEGNTIKGAYANSGNETYTIDDLFTISSSPNISSLTFTSVSNFSQDSVYVSSADAQSSGTSSYTSTVTANLKVNDTKIFENVPVNITEITNKLSLRRSSVSINTYRGTNGYEEINNKKYLYLLSNYELRFDSTRIVDWYDRSQWNRINISNYVNGISITNVTYGDYDANTYNYGPIQLDSQRSHYINSSDEVQGRIKIEFSDGSKKYAFIKMSAAGKSSGSSSGGISISDVIIRAANQDTYSTSADKDVSLEYDYVRYDSTNDVIKGKVNISLGTATGTTTTQSLFITMDAKRKSNGSSSGGITINNVSISNAVGVAYLITPIEKSVSISQENINYENGKLTGGVTITLSDGTNTVNKNILVTMTAGSGVSSSSSWTHNILQPDLGVIYEGDKYLEFDNEHTVYDSNNDKFVSRVRINHSGYSQTYEIRVKASQKTGGSSGGTGYRVVNESAYVTGSSYTKLNLEYNAGDDQEITLPRVWNSYTNEYDSAYGLGYSTGYRAAGGTGTAPSVTYSIEKSTWDDSTRKFNFKVNSSNVGFVQFYKYNGTVRYSYQYGNNSSEDSYWFTLESGGYTQADVDNAYNRGLSDGASGSITDQAYNMGYAAAQGGYYEDYWDARAGAQSAASSIVDAFMNGWSAGGGTY